MSPASLQWREKDFYYYLIMESSRNIWVSECQSRFTVELWCTRCAHTLASAGVFREGFTHLWSSTRDFSPLSWIITGKEGTWETWRGAGVGWDALTWVSDWQSSSCLMFPLLPVDLCSSHTEFQINYFWNPGLTEGGREGMVRNDGFFKIFSKSITVCAYRAH